MITQRNSIRSVISSVVLLAGLTATATTSATVIHYGPGDSLNAWKEEKQTYDAPGIQGVGGAGRYPIGTLITTNSGDTRLDWANRTYAEAGSALHQTPLNQIRGNLAKGNYKDVDLYEIWIDDLSLFKAYTVQTADQTRVADPQLFLFDGLGHGIFANDNDPLGTGVNALQAIIDASLRSVENLTSGLYLLGISRDDVDPRYTDPDTGQQRQIFNEQNPYNRFVNDHASRDGDNIADFVVSSWAGTVGVNPDDTPYRIKLEGAYFADVALALTPLPEPGAVVLFGAGLAMMGMVRRRRFARSSAM